MSDDDILEIGDDGAFVIPEAPKKAVQLTLASDSGDGAAPLPPAQPSGAAVSADSMQEYAKKIFASINVNEYKIYDNSSDNSLNVVVRLSNGEIPTAITLEDGVLEIETSDKRCLTIPVDCNKAAKGGAVQASGLRSEHFGDVVVVKLSYQ